MIEMGEIIGVSGTYETPDVIIGKHGLILSVSSDTRINDNLIATVTGTIFTGPVVAPVGLSGSLQTVSPGKPYLICSGGITIITASSGQVFVGTSQQYAKNSELWHTPTITSSFDEEFDTFSPSNWKIINITTAGIPELTGTANFDMAGVTPNYVTGNNYAYKCANSWLQLQLPNQNLEFIMYKSISNLPTDCCIWGRYYSTYNNFDQNNNGIQMGLWFTGSAGSNLINRPSTNTAPMIRIGTLSNGGGEMVISDIRQQGSGSHVQMIFSNQGFTNTALHPYKYFILMKRDTLYHSFISDGMGNYIRLGATGSSNNYGIRAVTGPSSVQATFMGFWFNTVYTTTNRGDSSTFNIDFIRVISGSSGWPQFQV